MSFQDENLTFEQLPKAVASLITEVKEMKSLLQNSNQMKVEPADRWFNLQELCDYLPDRPAKQTVYGWIGQHAIPFHKKGKKLQFLKSEIDQWLLADQHQTLVQVRAQARRDFEAKKGGLL
ncbi:MAG: helix-turn-helix domain-containing protein [Bacteroidales bacterium]|nr:helix-turn-helix domain-containing protein [Bacteroidales bacterium]